MRFVEAKVTATYASGAVSVRTDDGENLSKIRSIFSGVEYDFTAGDRVVVATDGLRHFVAGEVRVPVINDQGKRVLRDTADDLVDLTTAKKIEIVNAAGDRARVLVDQAMILVDTGDFCASIWEIGQRKITNYAEALEHVMPGMASLVGSRGTKAYARYQWRSIIDEAGLGRALQHSPNAALNDGSTLEVRLFDDEQNARVTMYAGGTDTAELKIEPSGDIEVTTSTVVGIVAANSITLNSSLVNLGGANPANAVARADLVEQAVTNGVLAPYNSHFHTYVLPLIPSAAAVTTPTTSQMPPFFGTGCTNVRGE